MVAAVHDDRQMHRGVFGDPRGAALMRGALECAAAAALVFGDGELAEPRITRDPPLIYGRPDRPFYFARYLSRMRGMR